MLFQILLQEAKDLNQTEFQQKYSNPCLVFLPKNYLPATKPKLFNGLDTIDESSETDALDIYIRSERPAKIWNNPSSLFEQTSTTFRILKSKGHITFLDKTNRNSLSDFITLGRTGTNDIIVDNPIISKIHSLFVKLASTGIWKIIDQDSTNHTYLNGQKLKPRRPYDLNNGTALNFASKVEAIFYTPEGLWETLHKI